MAKQRTLVFIKYPHSTRGGDLLGIFSMLNKAGFSIEAMKTYQLAIEEAREFYAEHQGKVFFEELVQSIIEGPIIPLIIEKESDDIIKDIRDLVGDKDPAKAAIGTIRRTFGYWIGENGIHASDCLCAVIREGKIIFPERIYLLDQKTEVKITA